MINKLHDLIAKQGGTFNADFSLQVANNAQQIAALKNADAWTVMSDYAILRVTGKDSAAFLQGQFSNDVRQLDDEKLAQHSTYLNAKGRMLASFLLWKQVDEYWLLLKRDISEEICKRLSMYVLRAEVTISQANEVFSILAASGKHSEQALSKLLPELPTSSLQISASAKLCAIRLANGALLLISAPDKLDLLVAQLEATARLIGSEAWRYLDINAGIVWVGAASKEAFVPQMANMDKIGAISFNKGCYVGQEIVARSHYLGHLKRHLYLVSSGYQLKTADELYSLADAQIVGVVVEVCAIDERNYLALVVVLDAVWDTGVTSKNHPEQQLKLLRSF